jgi:PKD repeat protein
MFVDLKAGPLGSNGDIDVSTLTDKGAVKVEYTLENLDTVATFNVYAWNDNTTQRKGISWANRVVGTGCSGYTVLGPDYVDHADEFPTLGGVIPVYHPPETNFTANITSGKAPLTVQFSDTTAQSVKSWSWDFGDGSSSTEKDPVHVYTTAGTYTVALTGTNGQGISATKTRTGYIAVTSSSGSSSSGGGGSSGDESSTTVNGTVVLNPARFTANVTVGVPPLAVRFTDNSTARNITHWSWDFTGDGLPDSTDQNPVFVFRQIGTYPVSLTVNTSTGETFTATRPAFIRIINTPSLDSDVGWISSDDIDTGQDTGSDQSTVGVTTRITMMAPTGQDTNGYSPLGTKVAETLADLAIVTVVIGGGLILWRKM